MTVSSTLVNLVIPYPNMQSDLAKKRHMYVCTVPGKTKEMLLCISKKPKHSQPGYAPVERVTILPDPYKEKSPFKKTTIIDCDQGFLMENIHVPDDLLTDPKDLCETYMNAIFAKLNRQNYRSTTLRREELLYINKFLNKANDF